MPPEPIRLQQSIFMSTFSLLFRENKTMFHVNPLLSAVQRIHLKHQALFSSKDNNKKLKCRLLQFSFGA